MISNISQIQHRSSSPNTSRTSESFSDEDEAAVDREVIRDEPDEADEEEEGEGEDLFNDNYLNDYRELGDQDNYESNGLDDSMEDERFGSDYG
ncbi:DNA helicase [Ranunculus cassubicifolius]